MNQESGAAPLGRSRPPGRLSAEPGRGARRRPGGLPHNTRFLLILLVIALYALHQDFWFWRTATPLVFGFLPIGLFYHACYAVAVSLLMWLLVKYAWPSHLE